MDTWILFTLLAVLMQSIRTAAQKQLSAQLSAAATTLARYIYALPLVSVYLIGILHYEKAGFPGLTQRFLGYAVAASVAQIVATALMIKLFQRRSFAIGTTFAKTEALYAAVAGAVFFSQPLSAAVWWVVVLGVLGVWIMSVGRTKGSIALDEVLLGLGSGMAFAMTSLWLREASLSLGVSFLLGAATTLLVMVLIQTLMLLAYLVSRSKDELRALARLWRLGGFIGMTSALGSIGWFTAMTLQSVAYVKALGQLEFILVVMITRRYFHEKISSREYLGMAMIALSVLWLLWVA